MISLFQFKAMVSDIFDECKSKEEMVAKKNQMIKEIENSFEYNSGFMDFMKKGE